MGQGFQGKRTFVIKLCRYSYPHKYIISQCALSCNPEIKTHATLPVPLDIFHKNVIMIIMSDLNLSRLISKFVNYRPVTTNRPAQPAQSQSYTPAPQTPTAASTSASAQIANLNGTDRAAYVKDLMKLPKNINEFVYIVQRNMSQAQFQQQFNRYMANQRNMLSQTQAQILAQLQGLSFPDSAALQSNKAMLNQLASTLKNLPIMSGTMINLADISLLIQNNGKDAVTKLIMAMAGAAKQGVTDLTQMKDTAKLINASIAMAAQGDNAQTLKTLLLLYLPWLPLQEGTGFELDIEAGENSSPDDSILTITITTVNYGIVKAVLILENSNSVQVSIECSKDFPKDELLLRIEADEKHYSMQSAVTFSTAVEHKTATDKPQAKINMSNTNEINPYMLLMAHTIIRHTIELDKLA